VFDQEQRGREQPPAVPAGRAPKPLPAPANHGRELGRLPGRPPPRGLQLWGDLEPGPVVQARVDQGSAVEESHAVCAGAVLRGRAALRGPVIRVKHSLTELVGEGAQEAGRQEQEFAADDQRVVDPAPSRPPSLRHVPDDRLDPYLRGDRAGQRADAYRQMWTGHGRGLRRAARDTV
jgi:hypothetical protein